MGRHTDYTDEIADQILARLSKGQSLRSICRDERMPPESTVRLWAVENRSDFYPRYEAARNLGLDCIADEVLDIADDGTNDYVESNDPDNPGYRLNGEHIARSRMRFDARRWYLSKMAPKRYGDKLTQEHTGPNGGPMVFDRIERKVVE